MDSDSIERFHRLVRGGVNDRLVVNMPQGILDEIEQMGSDPRRPKTAIARWASQIWLEHQHENIRSDEGVALDASHVEKELMERPSHYPLVWGLDLIPFPDDVGGWSLDKTNTLCYTSLNTPRPFDPHLATLKQNEGALGWGYHYQSSSGMNETHDITTRRGGGPRGGFGFTTGPTEGAYPQAVLPQPTFNLGRIGFSNGGWNPEGLQWTNRPKQMKLSGLRNGWPHRVIFARSRQVLFRNLYGDMDVVEATPKAPIVVLNGLTNVHGVIELNMTKSFNSPTELEITINNPNGRRTGLFKRGDTIQIYAAPRTWATPPLLFTGFVSEIEESSTEINVFCLDSLGLLGLEVIKAEQNYFKADALTILKDIVANSVYAPPIGRIKNESNITLPQGLKFKGQTRLSAVQTILNIINSTPNKYQIYTTADGYIALRKLREVNDPANPAFTAGTIPRTAAPQDFYPTAIERVSGDKTGFNVVVVQNDELNISITVPAVGSARFPAIPIEKVVNDKSIVDEQQARMVGEYFLNTQGSNNTRWIVEGQPERFDFEVGDVMEFASSEGNLSGRQRIFDIKWNLSVGTSSMQMNVGRQAPDVISALQFALGISQSR